MRKRFDKLIEETSCFCDDEVSNMVEDMLSEDMKALPTNDAKHNILYCVLNQYIKLYKNSIFVHACIIIIYCVYI